jgi:transposase
MRLTTPWPHLAGLRLLDLIEDEHGLTLVVAAAGRAARCPACRGRSRRYHSSYRRTLADLPAAGRPVTIRLRVRRFRCARPTCPRRIFAERFPRLAADRARRTFAQRDQLVDIGLALGGQAGVRLARRLGLAVSRPTLLRLVAATPLPASPAPRVVGLDEWSRRRGRTYGAIVVDLERRRPVDLLPDHAAATVADWLRAHGSVEVVSRDRAGAFADGARQGAPGAIQVADRYHLVANAGEALERLLTRRHADLRAAAAASSECPAGGQPPPPPPPPPAARPPTRDQRRQAASRARRQARFDAVMALLHDGHSQRGAARALGLSPTTVNKYARAGTCPEPAARRRRPGIMAPYHAYLAARWADGCRDAAALLREIRARGFRGGRSTVAAYVAGWRTGPRRRGPYAAGAPGGAPPAPPAQPRPHSPRRTRWLLLREPGALKPEEAAYRARLLADAPEIALGHRLVIEFRRLVRERDHGAFAGWLAEAKASELPEVREFAGGIARDRAAVENALIHEWSNGQTEGQITKLKFVKRSMYGRAGLELLRRRLLAA